MKRERTPAQIQADKERMARVRAMRDEKKLYPVVTQQSNIPNVPRPEFVSVFLWNQHLLANGFDID